LEIPLPFSKNALLNAKRILRYHNRHLFEDGFSESLSCLMQAANGIFFAVCKNHVFFMPIPTFLEKTLEKKQKWIIFL